MNRNKLAMVDLDGTLIFTGRANYAAYRQALAEAGFALAEETFQTRCEGRSYRDFLMGERIPGHGKRFLHIEFSGFHIRSPFEEKMPDNAGISVFC